MPADLRYPIGKFQFVGGNTEAQRIDLIGAIAQAPARLRAAVSGLGLVQLDTPYRPGGWSVRQLVHHIADSHMNAVMRFKLTLTEDEPAVKTYEEARWAELADAKSPGIEVSLALIENLHTRWEILLGSVEPAQWRRKFRHPEWGLETLDFLLAQYAWHGRHHVAHITSLRERNGW